MVDDQREDQALMPQNDKKALTDEGLINSVRNILQLFVKTLAQVKLYSFHHTNTKQFVDELYAKFSTFLDSHGRLDLDIDEFSFLFQEEVVYEDSQITKSLPFLFHRDGVKTLSFHRGLEIEEIKDLFEIINEVSHLLPEEGDVVVLLWERDFANIHYYAPDEFLETKIGAGQQASVEYKLSRSSFETGHIELSPEDRETFMESKSALYTLEGFKQESGGRPSLERKADFPLPLPELSPEELEELEEMIQKDRSMSSEEEFVSLIIEMSYLEERTEEFVSIMEVLVQNHRELVQKGEFLKGASLLSHIIDLKEELTSQSREQSERIEKFLKEIRSSSTLSLIEKTFDDGHLDNLDAFFKYIYFFGSSCMKLIGDLYEKKENPVFRQKALDYLRYFIEEDLFSVMKVVGEHRPEFTKGILSVLKEAIDDRKAEHLAVFIEYKDPDLKKRAIRTLAACKSERASKVLMRFLEDKDGGVRTEAALCLQSAPDESLLSFLIPQVRSKAFHRKDFNEKSALLGLLFRFQSKEVLEILKTVLKSSHFLSKAGTVKTSISAVSALMAYPAPESLEILKVGLWSTHYKVRKAARKALAEVKIGRMREDS